MAAFNGRKEAMVYTVYHGRTDELLKASTGFMARYLPVYLRLDDGLTSPDHKERTARQLRCLKAHPELELPVRPGLEYFEMIRYNNLGKLLDSGEISSLIDEHTDLRHFDVAPGLIGINLLENEDEKLKLEIYYSKHHYHRDSMERFFALIKEAIRTLDH